MVISRRGRPANSKFGVNEIGLILSRRFCRDKFDFAWHRRGKRSKFINKRNGDLSVRPPKRLSLFLNKANLGQVYLARSLLAARQGKNTYPSGPQI